MAKNKKVSFGEAITKNLYKITAKSDEQQLYLDTIHNNQITMVYGPAGSGKSYLSILYGMNEFFKGNFDKIVLTRPCVEANGERLGFLPGNLLDKIQPYLLPIMNILDEKFDLIYIEKLIQSGQIQAIPFAFLRGLTFKRTFVLADESQNASPEQIRLLLTRIGNNSKIVMTGDITQSDIRGLNGLKDAINRLNDIESIGIVQLTEKSIVRNPIITEIEKRYLER